MKHVASRELFAYWNELRGARAAPERGDIDPVAIRHLLADTFMLDVDINSGFPFRLSGTRVNGLFDAEQKNQPFLSLWRAEERRNLAAVLLTVADGPCPVVAGAEAGAMGRDPISLECLFLPLRHHGKTHSRILGLIKTMTASPSLGLLPIGPLQLQSLRIIDTIQGDVPARIAVGQGHAPQEQVTAPRPTTRPYLHVIQGGGANASSK